MKHLTFSTPLFKITTDPHEDPFADFANLESLSLWHGVASHGHMDEDEKPGTEERRRHPVAQVLNNLHTRLKSLELSGLDLDEDYIVPGCRTTPELMKVLVHLSIDFSVTYKWFEYLLFNGRSLETLCLERLSSGRNDEMCRIKKPKHLPPRLLSVSLGFDDADLVRDGIFGQGPPLKISKQGQVGQ